MPPIDPTIPLVELHRHLDGNVRLATMLDIAEEYGIALPAHDEAGLRPHVQVLEPEPSLVAFLDKFHWLQEVFVNPQVIERIAYENLEDAVREGIDYIELRFSPAFMAQRYKLDPHHVTGAICAALARGREAGLPVQAKLIVILSRHLGIDLCRAELEAAIAHQGEGIVAVDLAGDEANFPAPLYEELFERARAAGFRITVHAGEAAGPQSIRDAIERLGAERIGHGVRAIEDPTLVEWLAEQGIPLEVCPTSNMQTTTVPSYAAHPLPRLLEAGLCVTLNTDDPSISGIDLPHEYRIARDELGLSEAQIHQMQRNGVEAAFLSDEERAALWAKKRQG